MFEVVNFLLNPTVWYVVFAIAGAVGVAFLCFKYVTARYITGTVLALALIASTIYCSVQLNTYYSAEGGIYGYLNGLMHKNQIEQVSDKQFKLTNIVLTGTVNDDEYIAEFTFGKYEFNENTEWGLFINDVPLSNVRSGHGYIAGNFNYNFYSDKDDVIVSDTLYVLMSFDNNGTHVTIKTQGGNTALKYWTKYIEKNGIIIGLSDSAYSSGLSTSVIPADSEANA